MPVRIFEWSRRKFDVVRRTSESFIYVVRTEAPIEDDPTLTAMKRG